MPATRKLQITTPSDREINFTREFAAPRPLVFEALTQPDLLKRWFYGPDAWRLAECEIDLRVGGKFRYLWRKEDGTQMGMGGVYREIVPPQRIVNTELFDEDWTGGETLCTLTLAESGKTTTMNLNVRYSSPEARDAALGTPMAEGMEAGYRRLDEYLASAM